METLCRNKAGNVFRIPVGATPPPGFSTLEGVTDSSGRFKNQAANGFARDNVLAFMRCVALVLKEQSR